MPEAVLAGEIMAQQLESFGFEVVRGQTYRSLAELEAGMRAGEFDLSAVFLQDALTDFAAIGESPVFDQTLAVEIVNNTIRDVYGYMLLDWWGIEANYTLAVRERLMQEGFGVGALAMFAQDMTLAATQDFFESPGGMAHLNFLFGGLEFREVLVVEQDSFFEPGRLDADIIALRTTLTGDWLVNEGFSAIGRGFSEPHTFEGISIWPSNHLVPVASEDVMERLPEIQAILSSVSFQIDPATFANHLREISQGIQTPELAAYEILQQRR